MFQIKIKYFILKPPRKGGEKEITKAGHNPRSLKGFERKIPKYKDRKPPRKRGEKKYKN